MKALIESVSSNACAKASPVQVKKEAVRLLVITGDSWRHELYQSRKEDQEDATSFTFTGKTAKKTPNTKAGTAKER